MQVWIVTTEEGDTRDVEVIDREPSPMFYEGLTNLTRAGVAWEVRRANVNGGDSQVVASNH